MAVKGQAKNVKENVAVEAKATEQVKEVEKEVVAPTKNTKKVRKELDRNMMVECRSVRYGTLTYVSKKTLGETNWNEFGDVEYLDLAELLTMKGSQPRFLTDPWIIIEDEDVVEFLGLKSVYEKIVSPENIAELFYQSPEELEETLVKAPRGTKDLIADKAREMVANEQLYDTRIIKVLNKVLNIDLFMVQA